MTRLPTNRLLGNGYAVAILATLALWIILEVLQPIFRGASPVFLFLVGVMLATWYGGFRAGVLATVLSALATAYFLVEPSPSGFIPELREMLRVGLLVGTGGLLSGVISVLRQADQRAFQASLERETAEQRYRELFEHSSDAIFLLDITADGRFRFAEVNPAEERLTGLSNTEAAGRFTEEVVPETLLERVNAYFHR